MTIINGYQHAIWNGITTLELAKAIEKASLQSLSGIYQLTPPKAINKYELLFLFKNHFNKDVEIKPYNNAYLNKTLKNTRTDFNYFVKDYPSMLKDLNQWIQDHQDFYPHYKNS